MPTLDELHNDYMKSRDLENDYEAQKINDYYCCTEDDIVELHWEPVSNLKKETSVDYFKYMKNKER